jgi:FKBP-type peptidyl-prolyl cis-trans isomerase
VADVSITADTPGTGDPAAEGKLATVHYTVTRAPNIPVVAPLEPGEIVEVLVGSRMMIDGWNNGLLGQGLPANLGPMKVGGQRTLEIPPDLAYGQIGLSDIVPPNSTLIFVVDLLQIRDVPTEEGDQAKT